MTNSTKQFIIILSAGVTALLVVGIAVLFGTGIYQGTVVVPEHVQTQIWTGIVGLIVVATGTITSYVNARNIARIREEAERNATYIQEAQAREFALNRETTNRSAGETQAEVVKVVQKLEDGFTTKLSQTTATLVDDNAKRTADGLAKILETSNVVRDAERRAREIVAAAEAKAGQIALGAKIDAVQTAPASGSVRFTPAAVQAGVTAIETNTAATELVAEQLAKIAENTVAVQEHTDATSENSAEVARNTEGRRNEGKPEDPPEGAPV